MGKTNLIKKTITMKVTMILSRFDQTGMTTHTIDLTEALVRNAVTVNLVVGYTKGLNEYSDKLYERAVSTGANIITVKQPSRDSIITKLQSALQFIVKIIKLRGVVHVQSPYLSWIPWIINKRFISTFHVNDLRRCFYYKRATHLIAISKETKDYAIAKFNYNPNNITIVNHGVSSRFAEKLSQDEINKFKKEFGLPIDKVIILLVGSIEKRKGHDILLRAVSQLPKNLRDKLHIVFLGSDKSESGNNKKWLEESISTFDASSFVSIYEYQDSELFYKLSDVFVLPSWLEGFGLVVVEAMLSECLCIRTDTEGAYEQIRNEETGFIFKKGEADELSDILRKVLENEDLRKEIAGKGKTYALNHFTSDIMAKNTIKVYKKLICK